MQCLGAKDGVLTVGVLVPGDQAKRRKLMAECRRHERVLVELAAQLSRGAWTATWEEILPPAPPERQRERESHAAL